MLALLGLHRAAAAVPGVSLASVSVPSVLVGASHVAFSDILHLPGLQGDYSGLGCGPCVEDCRWLVLKHNCRFFGCFVVFFFSSRKISVVAVGQTLQS